MIRPPQAWRSHMCRLCGFGIVAAALSACAHSSATSGTGPATTTSTATADRNPCAVAGTCSVEVVIPSDVANDVARAGANYRVYPGCPRSLGFRENATPDKVPFIIPGSAEGIMATRSNSTMRGAIPLTQTSNTTVIIPKMSGRYATVAIFLGNEPGKYAVADFSKGPDQTVKFGYSYNGRSIGDDRIADGENRTAERRACP